jgi:hypothetical protein|nr:hypothetical protein [Kofleriaceae bacterium]
MSLATPRLRWKTRVGFGGGHHPYYGVLHVCPFGVIASGGARSEETTIVDADRGEARYQRKALSIGVVGTDVITSTRQGDLVAYDASTGVERGLSVTPGERPFHVDARSLFVVAPGDPAKLVCERAFDPRRGAGDVVRVFGPASHGGRATSSLVSAGAAVYDRATGDKLGQGTYNITLAEPGWFAIERDRIELHARTGVQWTCGKGELAGWDPRIVVVTTWSEGDGSSLVMLDRASGRTLHTTKSRPGKSWEGWGKAIVFDDHVVANDKHDERDRSILRALAFDGSEHWKLSLGENVWVVDVAATAARLYVLTASGHLHAFDR